MADCKVAVIGAGSYVFGHSLLNQAYLQNRLQGIHLALMDIDTEMVDLMAGVGRRFARSVGIEPEISVHRDRCSAMQGADFVICSVAQQQRKRFLVDVDIVDRIIPDHWTSEFGGVTGISYSLRQIPLFQAITEDMKRVCPGAWLLTSSNPLPRVCQAAHENGVRTAGFCSASINGYGLMWRLFEGESTGYPYEEARRRWRATMMGLNHFSWLLGMHERASGRDERPAFRDKTLACDSERRLPNYALLQETGYHLFPWDGHVQDFLPTYGPPPPHHVPLHGTADERAERIRLLGRVADGREPVESLLTRSSWERPMDFIAGLAFGREAELHAVNFINDGIITNLIGHVFVEAPCTVTADGPSVPSAALPDDVLSYCERTAQVTDTIVAAARERSLALLAEAVELDPTILDKAAGRRALRACLEAHADIVPEFS